MPATAGSPSTPGVYGAGEERGAPEGRAYLARRKSQRGTRDERHRMLLDVSREVHARLSDCAVDAMSVADIDLVHLGIQLFISSEDTARALGRGRL